MKMEKISRKKSVLAVIFLALLIFIFYFLIIDKFSHPISPDSLSIPECSSFLDHDKREDIFCQAKFGVAFDLIEVGGGWDSSCKVSRYGGCTVYDVSYDKKYIQMERRSEGKGCNVSSIYRFKGIKKGYTEIVVDGTCHFGKKYKIFIK